MTTYNEESRKNHPTKARADKRDGGIIQNWSIIPYYGDSTKMVIVGSIVDDARFGSDKPIRTSLVLNINEDETEAETLNTIYKLGTKAPA